MKKGRRTLLTIMGVCIILLCCMSTFYGTANNPETKKGAILTSVEHLQHLQVEDPLYFGNPWYLPYCSGNPWYSPGYCSGGYYSGSHWYSSYHYYGSVGYYSDEIIKVFSNKRAEEYSYKNKTVELEKPQEYLREEFLPLATFHELYSQEYSREDAIFALAFLALENREISQYEEDGCSFCDGDELTLREKCEELLYKVLIDEKNLLDDGVITEEVYHLQCEPFEKWLDRLETLPEEELQKEYIAILEYHLDKVAEEWTDGKEVDEYFFAYIVQELEKYYGLEQKKSEAGKIEFARFALFYCYRFSKVSRFIDI